MTDKIYLKELSQAEREKLLEEWNQFKPSFSNVTICNIACNQCGRYHPSDFDCKAYAFGNVHIGDKPWHEYFGYQSWRRE